jgi:hypothetical protein
VATDLVEQPGGQVVGLARVEPRARRLQRDPGHPDCVLATGQLRAVLDLAEERIVVRTRRRRFAQQ